jgi:glutamate/tyrosine decarboxylase-like PLP-dependent enzyme
LIALAQPAQSFKGLIEMTAPRPGLPRTGTPAQLVLAEMDRIRAGDTDWTSPKNLTASYYGGPDVAEVARQGFVRHIGDNVIQQAALHPSVKTYEREVIDFTLSLFRAPEGATGTITTGGSESIALALRTARDRARDLKGITAPEIIVPQSGYAVFDKLSQMLGIKVIRMSDSPKARADVDGMARAITPNTILLVASAPPYPLCTIDPVAEIAALAARHDLWCHVDACVGGFMLPFARMLGQDIPDFDFAIPGVTSISADLHKYGYAYRGCSVLCLRDKALERWQGFATDAWNGGAYFSKTLTGSRNAGPVASAWAVMQYLGVDGYMRITSQIIAMREAFLSGIRAMEGLEVIGTPQGPHFAFAAPGVDILSIAGALVERGWGINLGVRPDCIILLPSAHHLASAPEFLSDLETIMAQARAGTLLPPSDPSIFGIY